MSAEGGLRRQGNLRLLSPIVQAVSTAWAYQVRQAVSHRNGLGAVDAPDVGVTVQLLQKTSGPEQRTLARHFTAGFQTGATKVLWQVAEDGACPWRGQLETLAVPGLPSV